MIEAFPGATMTTDHAATAKAFHEAYERLAPSFGYETRKESAVPWEDVPENNRALMTAVCAEVVGALVAERDEALRLRDKSDEAHHREYTGRMAAEAALAEAQRELQANSKFIQDLELERGLIAERDEARRDWQQYVHEVKDEQARADAAEADRDTLAAALRAIIDAGCYGYSDCIEACDKDGPRTIARAALASVSPSAQENPAA